MRTLLALFFLISIFSQPLLAKNQIDGSKNKIPIEAKIELLENKVNEVKRDQLNYKIEKNLLKETYSSNLQTVNVLITIVLGTFTVLAFFGIRSIGDIRQEFSKELEQLRDIRARSENRLQDIEAQQKKSKARMEEIASTNMEQDHRLKVLEIQESAISKIKQDQFKDALKYIDIGLDLDQTNQNLLMLKEYCLRKLGSLDESIEVMEKMIELDPSNESAALNLCEMRCLVGPRDRFNELSIQYRDAIQKRPYLAWLFTAIDYHHNKQDEKLEQHIKTLLESLPDKRNKNTKWNYDECRVVLSKDDVRPTTQVLFNTFKALNGEIAPSEVFTEKPDGPEGDQS